MIRSVREKKNKYKAKGGADRAGRLRRGAAVAVVVGGGFYSILRWKSSPVVAITATAALNPQFAKWHSVARGLREPTVARARLISQVIAQRYIINIIGRVSERPGIRGSD